MRCWVGISRLKKLKLKLLKVKLLLNALLISIQLQILLKSYNFFLLSTFSCTSSPSSSSSSFLLHSSIHLKKSWDEVECLLYLNFEQYRLASTWFSPWSFHFSLYLFVLPILNLVFPFSSWFSLHQFPILSFLTFFFVFLKFHCHFVIFNLTYFQFSIWWVEFEHPLSLSILKFIFF